MRGSVSEDYNLLSATYRLTLNLLLCKFKEQLIHQCVWNFDGLANRSDRERAILPSVTCWEEVHRWLATDEIRCAYEQAFSRAIEELCRSGVIVANTPVHNRAAAQTRFHQIEAYIRRTLELWRSAAASCSTTDAVLALSESLSPYYGIVYPVGETAMTYNFAIWLQQPELLARPYLTEGAYLSQRAGLPTNLARLYPETLTKEVSVGTTAVFGGDPDLTLLLSRASDAFLDFDETEKIVGLVQTLDSATLLEPVLLEPVRKALEEPGAVGRFTDLLFFIKHVIRLVLPTDVSNSRKARVPPNGILFLASPALDGITKFLRSTQPEPETSGKADEHVLADALGSAWRSIGGDLFSQQLQEAVLRFRKKLQMDRVHRTYSVAHPLKHRLGRLRGEMEFLVEDVESASPAALGRAIYLQSAVRATYGFIEMTHMLHYASMWGPSETLKAMDEGRPRFGETGPLDVTALLINVAKQNALGDALIYTTTLQKPVPNVRVQPFANLERNEPVRLKEVLYEEALFEACRNAASHGSDRAGTVPMTASVCDIEGNAALCLSNPLRDGLNPRDLERKLGHSLPGSSSWHRWSLQTATGLSFVANALRATEAGTLYFRVETRGNENWFAIGLQFRGLEEGTERRAGGREQWTN